MNNVKHLISDECGCLPYALFKFPLELDMKKKWVRAINRQKSSTDRTPWEPSRNAVVCSVHFIEGHPSEKHPIPTLNLGYTVNQEFGKLPTHRLPNKAVKDMPTTSNTNISKSVLITTSTKRLIPAPATSIYASTWQATVTPVNATPVSATAWHEPMDIEAEPACFSDLEVKPKILSTDTPAASAEVQHDECNKTIESLKRQFRGVEGRFLSYTLKIKAQRNQLRKLQAPVHKILLKCDKDAKFYAGIPNLAIFKSIVTYYDDMHKSKKNRRTPINISAKYRKALPSKRPTEKLLTADKILLVLMKLRLGSFHKDLADR